jgi:hypothetical protein
MSSAKTKMMSITKKNKKSKRGSFEISSDENIPMATNKSYSGDNSKFQKFFIDLKKKKEETPCLAGHTMIKLSEDPTIVIFGGLENSERTNNTLTLDLESRNLKFCNWEQKRSTISNLFSKEKIFLPSFNFCHFKVRISG